MSQRAGSLFDDVEQVLQDREIAIASFRRTGLVDVSSEHDMSDLADPSEFLLEVVTVEEVCDNPFDARRHW